jgi:hypothetical protein
MLEQLHADKVMQQGARSSVVNGPFTGTKERRSFKPKVASSILVGRIRGGAGIFRVLAMPEPNTRLAPRIAFPTLPGDSRAFREVVVSFSSHFRRRRTRRRAWRGRPSRPEGVGDALDGAPSRVGFATLDQGQGFRRDPRVWRKSFLRDTSLLSKLADSSTQCGLWLRGLTRPFALSTWADSGGDHCTLMRA